MGLGLFHIRVAIFPLVLGEIYSIPLFLVFLLSFRLRGSFPERKVLHKKERHINILYMDKFSYDTEWEITSENIVCSKINTAKVENTNQNGLWVQTS